MWPASPIEEYEDLSLMSMILCPYIAIYHLLRLQVNMDIASKEKVTSVSPLREIPKMTQFGRNGNVNRDTS